MTERKAKENREKEEKIKEKELAKKAEEEKFEVEMGKKTDRKEKMPMFLVMKI